MAYTLSKCWSRTHNNNYYYGSKQEHIRMGALIKLKVPVLSDLVSIQWCGLIMTATYINYNNYLLYLTEE